MVQTSEAHATDQQEELLNSNPHAVKLYPGGDHYFSLSERAKYQHSRANVDHARARARACLCVY